MTRISIFQRPVWAAVLAFTAAFLWGWAYPLIKLGFTEFEITTEMTGSKMLFAGIRFFISGLIILSVAHMAHRSFGLKEGAKAHVWWSALFLLAFTLLNTTLHYACFYIGLSHSQGSRAAILNSLSVFVLVILACMFFKSDKLTMRKVTGCAIGFAGILALNLSGVESGSFTLLGDGMIILNALCGAGAGLMTRDVGKRVDVFVGTGYSLGIGGDSRPADGWHATSRDHHRPLLPADAHRYLDDRLHAVQQAAHVQSCGQDCDMEFTDTRSRRRHVLPVPPRGFHLELCRGCSADYCGYLCDQ